MTAPGAAPPAAGARHVRGLDALRFVLALWVVLSHSGFAADPLSWRHTLVRSALNATLNGAAAVIAFFVISGFCIHYPYRAARSINLLSFYARRHIRVLLPVVAAVLITRPLGALPTLWYSVLWSLVCEEIYYTIYPLLLALRARTGWEPLIAVSVAAAVAVIALVPSRDICSLNAYSWSLNWVVGLPAWLGGAWLAERLDLSAQPPTTRRLWSWRAGAAVLVGSGAILLCFHASVRVPFAVSLTLATPYLVGWLRAEILRAESAGPLGIEALGAFSYSMYLVHLPLNVLFDRLVVSPNELLATPMLMYGTWLVRVIFVVLGSWLFSRVVEQPAHRVARRFQQHVLAWRTVEPPTLLVPTPDHG